MLIKQIFKQYRWSFIFTFSLILIEAFLVILFPLFIGNAIGDAINKSISGIIELGILGVALIVIGALRRMYDSRFYAKIYTNLGLSTLGKLYSQSTSVKTARLNMLAEMVKFAEDQLPEIIHHSIGLLGVIGIIAFLNLNIFILAIISGIIILILYLISSSRTITYNEGYNNELEEQVNVIEKKHTNGLKRHLLKLMKWNIKLSDLETINYSASWIIMIFLLLASIYLSSSTGVLEYGALFALIMYVYQYIESISSLPLYYQQWLRLKEINNRFNQLN